MATIHLYRLLLDLTSSQSISTRIPPTIIYGFGFPNLTLLGGLPIKAMEGELSVVIKGFLKGLPFAVLKCSGGVKVCTSLEDAYEACRDLLRAQSNPQSEHFVLQQFLKPPTDRPFFVRIQWKKGEGIRVRIHESAHPFPEECRPELAKNFLVRAGVGSSVRLSQYTGALASSFSQLTNLMQRLCAEELDTLSGDYLQDSKGTWHLMSISSYSYSQRKVLTSRPSVCKTASMSPSITRRASIASIAVSAPEVLTTRTIHKKVKIRQVSAGRLPDLKASGRRMELQREGLVRDILGSRGALKHTTYKKWLQRTSSCSTYLPLDKLFASSIAKKAKEIQRSSRHEVEDLKALVRTLRKQQESEQTVTTDFVLYEVGRFLLKLLVDFKARSAEVKARPVVLFTPDSQTLMSKKVMDRGTEMLDLVRLRLKKPV